jgi:hypothetical protein
MGVCNAGFQFSSILIDYRFRTNNITSVFFIPTTDKASNIPIDVSV